jgi:hypothetical protein
MSRHVTAGYRRCRAWLTACLVFGLVLPAHGDGWAAKYVPDPQNASPRCMLESPRWVIDDGYAPTSVWVRVDPHLIHVVTESDIDLSFHDVGLRVDDGGLTPPDAVQALQNLVFARNAAPYIKTLQQGKTLSVDLRFWPTWPSQGRRTVTFDIDGLAPALARLVAGC